MPSIRSLRLLPAITLLFPSLSWGSLQPAEAPASAPSTTRATSRPSDKPIAHEGRDTRHWVPPRFYDFDRMVLHLDLPDLGKAELTCSAELYITSRGRAPGQFKLDADSGTMSVAAVKVDGGLAAFEHRDNVLSINLPPALVPGEHHTVWISYSLHGPFPDSNALVFTPASGKRTALMFSQGETNNSHYWFPCRDEPDTKIGVTEIVITPPPGTEALATGELIARTRNVPGAASAARETFHYRLAKPNAAYLTVVAVGNFEKKELTDAAGKVALAVYRPKGSAGDFSPIFDKTPAMLDFFRRRLGVEFPWPLYRQLQIKGFTWNGMENTTLTTLDLDIRPDPELEMTVAHELFHHWFGDLITCKAWDHVWIQEGWATYSEGLWAEHTQGQEGYRRLVAGWIRDVSRRSRGSLPAGKGLVNNRWQRPDETFEQAEDAYSRGGIILHMIRRRIGDDAFFRGTKLFLERFAYKSADSADLMRAYEDASGDSLDQFFDQWVYRPGIPRISVTAHWVEGDKSLVVNVRQTQFIDSQNPAYKFDLAIRAGGKTLSVPVDSKETTARFVLGSAPESVDVDPELDLLAGITLLKGDAEHPIELKTPGRRTGFAR